MFLHLFQFYLRSPRTYFVVKGFIRWVGCELCMSVSKKCLLRRLYIRFWSEQRADMNKTVPYFKIHINDPITFIVSFLNRRLVKSDASLLFCGSYGLLRTSSSKIMNMVTYLKYCFIWKFKLWWAIVLINTTVLSTSKKWGLIALWCRRPHIKLNPIATQVLNIQHTVFKIRTHLTPTASY